MCFGNCAYSMSIRSKNIFAIVVLLGFIGNAFADDWRMRALENCKRPIDYTKSKAPKFNG